MKPEISNMNKLSYNIPYQRTINDSYWLGCGMANNLVNPMSGTLNAIEGDVNIIAEDLLNNLVAYRCTDEVMVDIEPQFRNMETLLQQDIEETELYFYHGDHLGSSSWITDGSGNVNQYLAYMPFGESFIDQRNGNDIRFKFTGKERDSETGMDYFGARYYASDLSIWLLVDAYSSYYPQISPYLYVAGNPVMLVDPDGRKIKPNRFERRYNRKKERFEVSGKARHGLRLARYINRKGDKINKRDAYYNISTKNVYFDGYSSSTVSLKNPPKGEEKNLKGVNVVGGIVRGGTKDNIPFIKGYTSSSYKNIAARIRTFDDRHFDGDYWSFNFRDSFEKAAYKGLRMMTTLVFPIYAIFDRAFSVGNIPSNRKENEKKEKK